MATKTISKFIISIILLILAGFLFYKNFIKNDGSQYISPLKKEIGKTSSQLNLGLDIFENKIFKQLKQSPQVNNSNLNESEIGRQNPFIKF